MQVTETLSEGLRRAFTIVLSGADIEDKRSARLAEMSQTVTLPGFRPGKVPSAILRRRFGSAITAEVLEAAMTDAVDGLLKERGLRAAMQPKVDLADQEAAAKADSNPVPDIAVNVEVELLPEIVVPDLGLIELTRLKAEVAEDKLAEALRNLAERNRIFEDISIEELGERGAEPGEFVVVDYAGRADDEELVDGGKAENVVAEVGGAGAIPGFTEQLAGIRLNETRAVNVTFPDDYGKERLAGKRAVFDVTCKIIRRAITPDIDDEFAVRLAFENAEELRQFVRGQMQREYDTLARQRLQRQLLDKLNDLVGFDLPPGLVDAEFNQIWARIEADRNADRLDEEDKGKDEATLRADYRAIAERRVRLGLLLAEIAQQNGVSVSADELNRAVHAEAARYRGQEKQVFDFFRQNPRAADTLRGPIFEQKTVDFILGKVKLEERTVTPEELGAEPEMAAGPEADAEPEATSEAEATPATTPETTE